MKQTISNSVELIKHGKSTFIHSILLEGQPGAGKTSIAAETAKMCGIPYIKFITPENYIGYTENAKINAIVKCFDDAYHSPISCIVLDNIERLIEFVDIGTAINQLGPRFSNVVLQALLVLIKKAPKYKENKMFVIGTTSQAKILKQLEIVSCFNLIINVPNLESGQEIVSVLSRPEYFNCRVLPE